MTFTEIRFRMAGVSVLNWLLLLSIVAIAASFTVWWQVVYKSPQNVFSGMIKNNFATSGYARHVVSSDKGINADELAQLQTGGNNSVLTKTTLKQSDDVVTTEAISTSTAEYVRYTNIETKRKDPNGKQLDFSKAVNVWAKGASNGLGQTFNQMLLGVVPMGNVSPATRKELLDFMSKHTVFSVKYNNVKKGKVNGRAAYTYEVQLLPQAYVEMLKIYGKGVGLGDQVSQLNSADYVNAEPKDLVLTVDVVSRHLLTLAYPDTTRKETYSGQGIVKNIVLPKKTISTAELQRRLSPQ